MIVEMFRSLPRWARWLAYASLGVAAYFLLVEKVLDGTNRLSARAEARETALRKLAERSQDGGGEAASARMFGDAKPPSEPSVITSGFDKAIAGILKTHKISNHTATTRTAPMKTGPLVQAIPEKHLEALIREIKFEAAPETVTAVLADMERSPEVSAVTRVILSAGGLSGRGGDRIVGATVTLEAWTASPKTEGKR